MRKPLVPVDFSERALAAVEHAASLKLQLGGQILLLHVIPAVAEWEREGMDLHLAGGFEEAKPNRLESAKDQIKDLAQKVGVETHIRVSVGDAATEICRTAKDERVDLIVMQTHGFGPFRRFLLGSVTAKVLDDAECPVFTGGHAPEVRSGDGAPYRQTACAVDLREHSEDVLCWAAGLAAAHLRYARRVPNSCGVLVVRTSGVIDPGNTPRGGSLPWRCKRRISSIPSRRAVSRSISSATS
jgi:nucleotide-binding universal stress UspA family protein